MMDTISVFGVTDTVIAAQNISLHVYPNPVESNFDWVSISILSVAFFSLLAAIFIPFAQKKYEERKTKESFRLHIKMRLGDIYNFVCLEKIEYHDLSITNDPTSCTMKPVAFIKKLNDDFKDHRNSVQPRIIFSLLMNIQNVMLYSYKLRNTVRRANLDELTDKTLEHGTNLTRTELNNVYTLALFLQHFVPISLQNDVFYQIKSIQRVEKEESWVGLKVESDLLQNQKLLNHDLLFLNDNEFHLKAVIGNVNLLVNKVIDYYGQPGE